jgi:long-chain acyl-CoA synthetase
VIAWRSSQSLGAVVVPIYPTIAAAQVEFLLQDCAARLIFVSNLELLERIVVCRKRLVELSYVIAFDPKIHQPGVMRLDTLYKIGNQGVLDHPDAFCRSVEALHPESVATIIYTSGTTGIPKGAMLTHRNLVSNIRATRSSAQQ